MRFAGSRLCLLRHDVRKISTLEPVQSARKKRRSLTLAKAYKGRELT
jgi:hypothetical protein